MLIVIVFFKANLADSSISLLINFPLSWLFSQSHSLCFAIFLLILCSLFGPRLAISLFIFFLINILLVLVALNFCSSLSGYIYFLILHISKEVFYSHLQSVISEAHFLFPFSLHRPNSPYWGCDELRLLTFLWIQNLETRWQGDTE